MKNCRGLNTSEIPALHRSLTYLLTKVPNNAFRPSQRLYQANELAAANKNTQYKTVAHDVKLWEELEYEYSHMYSIGS